MDFSRFDRRSYRTVPVREGYREWAATYEDPVLNLLDLALLEQLESIDWKQIEQVADLACGTGRIGQWLRQRGIGQIDGVDLTSEMLRQAQAKAVYRQLHLSDISKTPLPDDTYDLVTAVLVDEHLPELGPLYQEAARISRASSWFVLVGYHPFFLLNGVPTHFDSATGEPLAIECYIHLFSDHVRAAMASGWELREMREAVVDCAWLEHKPTWDRYLGQPISFTMVWRRGSRS